MKLGMCSPGSRGSTQLPEEPFLLSSCLLVGLVILFYSPPYVAIPTEPTGVPATLPLPQSLSTLSQKQETSNISNERTSLDIETDDIFDQGSYVQEETSIPTVGQVNQQVTATSETESNPTNLPQPVKFVRQHTADRLGITPDSIKVIRIEHIVWPDGCLGLPAPELCAPGEVPGFRVILQALEKRYVYNTDKVEGFQFVGSSDVQKE